MNVHLSPIEHVQYIQEPKPMKELIYSMMLDIIMHAKDVPGLKSEEFANAKDEIIRYLNLLIRDGVIDITAIDKDVRPSFVGFQAVMEQALSNLMRDGQLKTLIGVILTPMPATPLCSKGEISKELVDTSIEKDPNRLYTVPARATIIRDYLYQGGDLYIAYPKDGINQRTKEQQSIYLEELSNYKTHLFDRPLATDCIDTSLIGATYGFTDKEGQSLVFSIKMSQAKDPKEKADFGLWFGAADNEAIKDRVETIISFINDHTQETIPL